LIEGVARSIEAARAAERFLLARQSSDRLWRDYPSLEPGPSEGWVTAIVGWSLTLSPAGRPVALAVTGAAEALHALACDDGWGYNRFTACDADSTAWAWRFLAQIDSYGRRSAIRDLCRNLSQDGAVRTFRGARFGAWGEGHADVTPVVGVALSSVQAPQEIIARVRHSTLGLITTDGLWPSYWWTTSAYAIARNLEFLAASGGIPEDVLSRVRRWLDAEAGGSSPFVIAQELAAAVCAEHQSGADRCAALINLQEDDGGWAASRTLRVPPQSAIGSAPSAPAPIFADERRVMSTAMAMAAIKCWLTSQARR
jgi:hypothetical protein